MQRLEEGGMKADLDSGQEYLTFSLGNEEYGIDILVVQELRGFENATRIANAPDYLKGVVNLRGIIVPILDMRIKFNLERVEYTDTTVVIVINIDDRVIGMVVDAVSDVLTLKPEEIKPAPTFGSAIDTQYVTGVGTVDERMLILVDIKKLLGGADLALLEEAAESA